MPITPSAVDAFLGRGEYQTFIDTKRSGNDALIRFKKTVTHEIDWAIFNGAAGMDRDKAEKLLYDYQWGLEQVSAGKSINKDQIRQISDMAELSVELLVEDSDTGEAITMAGIAGMFIAFPYLVFIDKVNTLQQALVALQGMLVEAKKKRNEAWIQGGIDAVLTVVTVLVPEMPLLIKASIWIGKGAIDRHMGVDKPPAVGKTGAVSGAFGTFSKSAATVLNADAGQLAKIKLASRGAAVVNTGVDALEIKEAYDNVAKINDQIEQVQKALTAVAADIRHYLGVIQRNAVQFERVRRSIEDGLDNADQLRQELIRSIQSAHYNTSSPTIWR